MDPRQTPGQRSAQAGQAAWRHCTLRRRRGRRASGAAGTQQEEGRGDHLGRQRHKQPHGRVRGEAVDPRDRSPGLRDRDRLLGYAVRGQRQHAGPTIRAPGAAAARPSAAYAHPVAVSCSRRPPSESGSAAAADRSEPGRRWQLTLEVRRQRRPRQRRRTPRHHRRQRRPHRDYAVDARPRSRDVGDRRRTEQAVYLGYAASGPKDGRWHAIRVEVRDGGYHVRARRGYVAGR